MNQLTGGLLTTGASSNTIAFDDGGWSSRPSNATYTIAADVVNA